MTPQVQPIRLLAKTRGVLASLIAILVACGAVVVLSTSETGLFSLVATGVTPLARLVTVLVGIAIAAPLVPRFERDYLPSLRRDVQFWGLGIGLVVSIVVGLILALVLAEPNVWAMPRLLTFWTFLSLLSSNVAGSRYGWLLTCAGQRGNLSVLPARFHIELEYHYVHPELAVPLGNRPLHCACGNSVRTDVALTTTTDCLRNYLGD